MRLSIFQRDVHTFILFTKGPTACFEIGACAKTPCFIDLMERVRK